MRAPYDAVIDTPFGRLAITLRGEALAAIDWVPASVQQVSPRTPLARAVVDQLARYFTDPTFRFDLPLVAAPTDFQARVREALCAIPAGEVRSYGELARMLHSSARAVGGACRNNPVPIVVPCHRVVAAQTIGGFGGETAGARIDVKKHFLRHEGARCAFIT